MEIKIGKTYLETTRCWIHFERGKRGLFWSWRTGEYVTDNEEA